MNEAKVEDQKSKPSWRKFMVLSSACVLACALAAGAVAQQYPARPIRLIVPFPPGGSNDIVARLIGAQLTERLGKSVVVDNRGGAGGTIGTEAAVRSQPDGYTLLVISVAYAYNPSLYKLTYDPLNAISPVAMMGTGPNALAVHPSLPAKSVKELIALAKARPGEIIYASAGIGTFQHLSSELFKLMAGVNMLHVPFKGGGPATISVVAGQSQVSIGSLIQTLPHIRTGKLRALGVGGTKRSATLPEVPTIAEAGVPRYEASNWWGIVAPAGTPPVIVKQLNGEIGGILNSPDVRKWFASEGAEPVSRTPEEFGQWIRTEMDKWGKVVKQAGIKAE
jgi:tripartite-type tricarboxylate transporter receptor subunit TctC